MGNREPKMASSVLGHIEKPGKGRVKIRWYSVNNLRTRVEQNPHAPSGPGRRQFSAAMQGSA